MLDKLWRKTMQSNGDTLYRILAMVDTIVIARKTVFGPDATGLIWTHGENAWKEEVSWSRSVDDLGP